MKLQKFKVLNYRNILDSGWIDVNVVTAFVGQNEAGKSNLFEALHCLNPYIPGAAYDPNEDWPVDDWPGNKNASGKVVCQAVFDLTEYEIEWLYEDALKEPDAEDVDSAKPTLPTQLSLHVYRRYDSDTEFVILGEEKDKLDPEKVVEWAKEAVPKFVLIHDYELSGTQMELDQLKQRVDSVGGLKNRHKLSQEDQAILVVLDLAQIDLSDIVKKGASAEGRSIRMFDKKSASKYLTKQFQELWTQKKVDFEIELDGTTLSILAEDENVGMPVRLHRRSTGFRWYVSFAWKFTHATNGEYEDCILLLEEPGIHLHYSGQQDLLQLFKNLSEDNTILYTTHLASMVDLANPERVRIVESHNHHLAISPGVVSKQPAPMAVIEASLGLTSDLSGMLGNRSVLIVEGGTDALILHKISGLLKAEQKEGLSDHIYLWAAQTASKTPMYAAFAVGQKWKAGVLLDSDLEGFKAADKIKDLGLESVSQEHGNGFKVLMLGKASGSKKVDFAIEDLFPEKFYLDCVNSAFGLGIKLEDLPEDGSTMISKRIEKVLEQRYGRKLEKKAILSELLARFDGWNSTKDLPQGTEKMAGTLFKKINAAFELGEQNEKAKFD